MSAQKKVFLAQGHGLTTRGVMDYGCENGVNKESILMGPIAKFCSEKLRRYGVDVETDYDTNNDRNMVYTVRDANKFDADIYVSLHCDFNKAPTGTLPIIYPGSSEGLRLANAINHSVMTRMKLTTRGIWKKDDYEVTATGMPACIFETGSIKLDINVIANSRAYGYAIAYGILDYFGIDYTSDGVKVLPIIKLPTIESIPQLALWDVENIQYFLNICNYGAPAIDDIPGPETERCIRQAQSSYHISVDSIWGHVTQGAATGQVKAYQIALNQKGFPCAVDGIPGPETFNAVMDFQRSKNLTADGIIGARTFPYLMG